MDLNMDWGIQISYGSSSESQLSSQSISIHLFNISKRKHKETYELQCDTWGRGQTEHRRDLLTHLVPRTPDRTANMDKHD